MAKRKVAIWKTFIKAMEVEVEETADLDDVIAAIPDEQWNQLEGEWLSTEIYDAETNELLYEADS